MNSALHLQFELKTEVQSCPYGKQGRAACMHVTGFPAIFCYIIIQNHGCVCLAVLTDKVW